MDVCIPKSLPVRLNGLFFFYIWVLVLYNNEFILCTVAKGALQNEVLLKVLNIRLSSRAF
jgi:hypothetical protein